MLEFGLASALQVQAFLAHAAALIHDGGGIIDHIDCTVICEEPRLGEHRLEMERILSDAVGAPVSVKATSNEGMGWVGRGEGIACIAVASIEVG